MSTKSRRSWRFLIVVVPFLLAADAAAPEVVATRCLTIQPTGPRKGENGLKYLNVEGTRNGKYTSYSLLTFPPFEGGVKGGSVEGLTLSLVQSIAKFSKDGKVRFLLVDADRIDPKDLKFVETSPDGLGDQFGERYSVGAGTFKKVESGQRDDFPLTLDDAARKWLEGRLEAKAQIHLLIVPDDEEVAATYFAIGEEEAERRPRLTLKPSTR